VAPAHNNLGLALRGKGDAEGAIASYREAIRLDPRLVSTHVNLGHALSGKGDIEGAIGCYREALRLDPKFAAAHNNLAWILATGPNAVRDGKLAVEHATTACELTAWKNPLWIDTLAAAYAETGDFDKAMEYQKKALSFPKLAKAHAEDGRKRLEQFAQKKPYRDPVLAPRELAPSPRPVMRW
jgi:tetratricopeptide (TPR) repeat protein